MVASSFGLSLHYKECVRRLETLVQLGEPLKVKMDGAQNVECTQAHMRISSTAHHRHQRMQPAVQRSRSLRVEDARYRCGLSRRGLSDKLR
jgi:ribosome-binding protein aMBF1 (putative translation factor)